MIILAVPAIVIGAMIVYHLVQDGYEGPYMEDTVVTLMLQALLIGCICLALWAFGIFSMTLLYVAMGVSFLPDLIGWIAWKTGFSLPTKNDRKRKRVERAIKRSPKYKEYAAFIQENGDRIAAVYYPCVVVYVPTRRIPFFVSHEGEYEITYDWNPVLGSPEAVKRSDFKMTESSWQVKRFFEVMPGERKWTNDEMYALEYVIRDALPRPKKQWNGNLTDIVRLAPAGKRIKELKRPY